MKQIDIPIGAKVRYRGKLAVCTEGGWCGKCIIYDCDKISCQAHEREDGKEVSFKEIKGDKMKVFSLEKFKELEGLADYKSNKIWVDASEGKTKEEMHDMGYGTHHNWMVEQSDTATIKGSKLEYHLLPPEQLAGMAQIMNHGVKTHETGYMDLDPLLYWNAAMRHLMALRSGETTDEEGNSHALAIACNGMILDRQLKAGKELRFER